MLISIIISTRNRHNDILNCLNSILANNYKEFEIIVIDQGDTDKTERIIKKINNPLIKYWRHGVKGLSKGRNFGIKSSSGEIIAFTDDDCLVDKNWLRDILFSFHKNKNIVGVFGKVLPYRQYLNKSKICPCIFLNNKKRIIDDPDLHWENIGFGNNMAFKRKIFNNLGGFSEWLGLGSIGNSAEDAEFALRALSKNYKILYNPKIKVWHNRWVKGRELKKQKLSYLCGEMACYGYFAFQGKKFAQKIIINNLENRYRESRKAIKYLIFFRKKSLSPFVFKIKEICFCLRGLLIGFYFAKKEPL